MIEPTEADIGRRVVYDVKKQLGYVARGTLVGLIGGPMGNWIQVQFDGDEGRAGPLNVGSHLVWEDDFKARR